MRLEDFGYHDKLEAFRIGNHLDSFDVGRVIAEHKERYVVKTTSGEFEAEITGNMRFTARNRLDFPAVGDWVALTLYESGVALIHQVYPRFSMIQRPAVGQFGEIQIIATNIDYAFLVQAVDRDFNINRIERYLTICNSSGVKPIIILSKVDLADELRINEIFNSIRIRVSGVPIIPISSETLNGYDSVKGLIEKRKTYCLLGSSGVGKSTLVNHLSGKSNMRTDAISQHTGKGRHVTSHRELFVLDNGGILIDNPGMREVGIADADSGLEITFDKIFQLSPGCKFKDCTHSVEVGCVVIEAVEKGEIDQSSYRNYLKMVREKAHFESTVAERREKDKEFGKFLKSYKKNMNKDRY